MDGVFEDWFEATPSIVGSRRPKIGAITAELALVLTYKDDPRSHRGALRGAN
jgi:hypothetical protein